MRVSRLLAAVAFAAIGMASAMGAATAEDTVAVIVKATTA